MTALVAARPAHAVPCFPGEIKLFAGNGINLPLHWIEADGRLLSIADYRTLFKYIGTAFGGDGTTTFGVPDLSNNAPLEHTSYLICATGGASTASTVVGEVVLYASGQPPSGEWGLANGQILKIDEHVVLSTIYGAVFGGDGEQTFALPNLSSKSPLPGVNYVVALHGSFPIDSVPSWVGETTILPGNMYPQRTMRPANGEVLAINRNLKLFAVIGTYFGGNGTDKFALPNLIPFVPASGMRYFITDQGEFPPAQ